MTVMKYKYYLKSDIGTTRCQNQDSAFAMIACTSIGRVFFGAVCDGMGGTADGGFASKYVTSALISWFDSRIKDIAVSEKLGDNLFGEWNAVISRCNSELYQMSIERNAGMGTTASLLLIADCKYYTAHLGDSRIYHYSGGVMRQITHDHSYVMELMQKGMLTESEALASSERNVLTKCIGCAADTTADMDCGSVLLGDIFLLSSDGFHGGLDVSDMTRVMRCTDDLKKYHAKKVILSAIEERKQRGETDNITALIVQAF